MKPAMSRPVAKKWLSVFIASLLSFSPCTNRCSACSVVLAPNVPSQLSRDGFAKGCGSDCRHGAHHWEALSNLLQTVKTVIKTVGHRQNQRQNCPMNVKTVCQVHAFCKATSHNLFECIVRMCATGLPELCWHQKLCSVTSNGLKSGLVTTIAKVDFAVSAHLMTSYSRDLTTVIRVCSRI